jgi:carbamoyltransferase
MNIILPWLSSHDASFIKITSGKLQYCKLERLTQIKHFGRQDEKLFEAIWSKLHQTYSTSHKFWYPSSFDHHYVHALSIDHFENQPCDIHIVIDGEGNERWFSVYRQNKLMATSYIHEANGSIGHGLAHSATMCGIKASNVLDLPGKAMGLQSYGKFNERHYSVIRKYNMDYLGDKNTTTLSTVVGNKNHLFAISQFIPPEEKIDVLHTIHRRSGEIILDIFKKYAHPYEKIGYSGGVAQNVVWNTMLKKHFPNLTIYPHCGDEGLSFGFLNMFGSQYEISKNLLQFDWWPFCQLDQAPEDLPSLDTIYKTAKYLAEGKIVAWYQGHGEVGPRALGNRSILFDPRIPNGKDIINKIKNREWYRPFGASILEEYAKEYFALDYPNPYMLYLGITQKSNLLSITHVDGTCRIQTVAKTSNAFRTLLEMFFELTGCPVLLNTSLNNSGKPIAGQIQNAIDEWQSKSIDILVVGNTVYSK